jgi:RNA-directed DNA polymerase
VKLPGATHLIVLCRSQQQAQEALEQVQYWAEENGLKLHPIKTRLVDASLAGGFDFLGYHFERGMKWPRKKSMDKLKERIRQKTRRTEGRSMRTICEDLSRTLRGWFGYFKHSKANVFGCIDGYVRGRLRSILRKRINKKGRGRGGDHQRWPNAYFTTMGLYSLKQAHCVVCRSS